MIIGIVTVAGAVGLLQKSKRLNQGEEVEGIIFGTAGTWSQGMDTGDTTVRFITKEGTWITKQYEIGLSAPFIKGGDKVRVKYNPNDPEDFVIVSSKFEFAKYVFLCVGIGITAFGVYKVILFILN